MTTGTHTPPPGSKEAVEAGCTCPILDNCRGAGIPVGSKDTRLYWHTAGCPVHHITNNQEGSQ